MGRRCQNLTVAILLAQPAAPSLRRNRPVCGRWQVWRQVKAGFCECAPLRTSSSQSHREILNCMVFLTAVPAGCQRLGENRSLLWLDSRAGARSLDLKLSGYNRDSSVAARNQCAGRSSCRAGPCSPESAKQIHDARITHGVKDRPAKVRQGSHQLLHCTCAFSFPERSAPTQLHSFTALVNQNR